ncbi:Linear gramicidin synthase subunit D [Fusarium oxysporum]|uniref:Linear gramicidin synthase subunit D n=1 Tax=Fusarium oxysporum TaxID=5507 RepID=A0A420MFI1_FUSOX|nr:Linear gramicidin synthase subunit D [Fusarium oxysporum]
MTDVSTFGQGRCAMDLFEQNVSITPQKLGVLSRRGILTYAALNDRANQLSYHIRSLGIGREDVVAVSLERGVDYVIALLALWKAGAAYLPLDVSMPHRRMQFMAADSGACCLISSKGVTDRKTIGEFCLTTLYLDDMEFITKLRSYPCVNSLRATDHQHLAYILYTSGTTGKPKGVAITHDNILNMVEDIRHSQEIVTTDRVMLFAPFCFDASIRDIVGALSSGASLYIPEENEVLPDKLVQTLRQQRITYVVVTPSVLRACVAESLPSLRTIVVAGEMPHKDLIKTWGRGRILINAYGPTEATVCSSKRIYLDGCLPPNCPISIGRAILNTRIYILDNSGEAVGMGDVGEICVSGLGVSRRGYLNLPDRNAESFDDDLLHSCRRYKTGDIGRILPNGEIEILGRKEADTQIKLHGQRIEGGEVEALLRSHPSVLDAVVVLRGAETARRLVAYVLLSRLDSECVQSDISTHLDAFLRDRLPSYSVPSNICFINSFPLGRTNKLDLDALPDPTTLATSVKLLDTTELLTAPQRQVLNSLIRVLGLPADLPVRPDMTYAELGGTSLLASTFVQQLNQDLGCEIHLGQVYRQNVSISRLADLISQPQNRLSPIPSDLHNRVHLSYEIHPDGNSLSGRPNQNILLTGATGFLGAHVLAELLLLGGLDVSCIVRASNPRTAFGRVKASLQTWSLWREDFVGRLHALPGDISQPFLGMTLDDYHQLAQDVGVVWHCAAVVNFISPYTDLEEPNVKGTVEVLRFASTLFSKKLVYVSTLAVFFGAGNKLRCGTELSTREVGQEIVTGYAQTKWLAEQLVLEYQRRGGHVLICRPGRLLGREDSGKCPHDDFIVRLIHSFLELGAAPDIEWEIDLTPVGTCAKAMIDLASQAKTGIYHFVNDRTVSLRAMVNCIASLGHSIRLVPYNDWRESISASRNLGPLTSLFRDPVDKSKLSAFEILLRNTVFRTSRYSMSSMGLALKDKQLLAFRESSDLLTIYLKDMGILL